MHLHSLLALAVTASLTAQNLVYDNGPLATGTSGTNVVSVLQTAAPISHSVFGYGAQQAATATARNALVDQFTVNTVLQINEIELFGYTTGSTAVSCTGVYVAIWNVDPSVTPPVAPFNENVLQATSPTPASGPFDAANNRISAATNTFTNIYRVTDTALTGTTRNIQSVRINLGANPAVLNPGTYWLEFCFNGINFVPPITTRNVASTGDGKQFLNTTLAYTPITNGTNPANTAGVPFKFYSSLGAPYGPGGITNLGGGCSTASLDVRGATTVGGYFRAELSNVNPQALGIIILGGSNPALPLIGICGCTQQASLDVLEVNNVYQLQVPLVAGLAGTQLYVQGMELDVGLTPQPCNVGIGFSLTDGFRYALNFN